jgi:hypothetical protein
MTTRVMTHRECIYCVLLFHSSLVGRSHTYFHQTTPVDTMLGPITATLLFIFLSGTPILGATVYSSAGDEYQCASYQSIENFYAGACKPNSLACTTPPCFSDLALGPQYTRSQDFINYGSVSSTTYNKAPEDYSVAPGHHTLTTGSKWKLPLGALAID